MPGSTGISSPPDFLRPGDEVGSLSKVRVHSHREKGLVFLELFPAETFISRLPYRVVAAESQNGLYKISVWLQ